MSYKVCIATAGTGSRLEGLTRYLNKSLVGIANRPTLCHILEQFPADAKFVIALGHKGNLVKEFLELAYPDKYFEYVHVDPFEGAGSGLGLSLLACNQYLQEPFVFTSCDTLVEEIIPPPDKNWMGFAETKVLDSYRTLEITNNKVIDICEKGIGKPSTHKAYIGLAGVLDFQSFWSEMERGGAEAIQKGESYGLKALIPMSVYPKYFTWHDTGNLDALKNARDFYRKPNEPNILEKSNEAIWFVDDHVIKFSDDKEFILNRVKRVNELGGFVPSISGASVNMYRYSKVDGTAFSNVVNLPLFKKLIDHSSKFWRVSSLNEQEQLCFKETCMRFYRDKTYERVQLFYSNFSRKDGREAINGEEMPLLSKLLNDVDWGWLAGGLPSRFHGDFHFENILWSENDHKFTFIDWRQDFGGNLSVGDLYYDFAKLLHGLIISHELIADEFYEVAWFPDNINFDFHRKQSLIDCQRYFYQWLKFNDYELHKVVLLTALIYLNIAPLHHEPYSYMLYALGKRMLKQALEKNEIY